MKPLFLYNTLSRSVEEFRPIQSGDVTYYSCGPTVYLPQHLGNMRAFLFTDTVRRVLEFNGYRVRHVMNITDVGHMTSNEDEGEDKIEKTARAEGKSPKEIADHYTDLFLSDTDRLNIERPIILSRATDHIADMIALIERIIARGYAYVVKSGVYFDVEKYRGENRRGKLSQQSLDEQQSSQRIEHASDKKSPHDFALWVLNQPHHLMQWDSPWGRGYPGWHIECSAMSMKYLGETIDVHSGGMDHIPIHHEDEIAQSESATGKPFVHYFVHNAFLVGMEGAKLSKSSGKFPVLADLINAGIHPLAFRLFCLGAKYRSELQFSEGAVRGVERNLERFYNFVDDLPDDIGDQDADWVAPYLEKFHEAINNDLNTPQAVAVALDLVGEAYRRNDRRIWSALRRMDQVLGLDFEKVRALARQGLSDDVRKLSDERENARRDRNFTRADAIRGELMSRGYSIEDTPTGPRVKRRWSGSTN